MLFLRTLVIRPKGQEALDTLSSTSSKEPREAISDWNESQIHEFLLQRNNKWLFNLPSGSHFGGVWERCIRTFRKILVALMKEKPLDDEGLTTLMCEVELIVDGRPTTKSSDV